MKEAKANVFQGDLTVVAGRVYEYERVTGSIDASGADTKAAFPKLTSVGGSIDASGADFVHVKQNDRENQALTRCRSALLASFTAAGFSFADGILARIVSQRGPVARVVICGKTVASYLVTNGEAHSHGKTLAEARDGLLYKIGSRDTSEFEAWTLDKVVDRRDAIRAYRIITGACEGGVRAWMEQRETPEKISVSGIIDLTRGAYGAEQFAGFFKKSKVPA